MPPSSLRRLATLKCIQNVQRISDFGDTPFELAQPILMKVVNPRQLVSAAPCLSATHSCLVLSYANRVNLCIVQRQIEINSPHFKNHTKELWLEFIKRDVPRFQDLALPEHAESWYSVYRDLVDQSNRQFEDDAAKMFHALQETARQKEKSTTKVVDLNNNRRLTRFLKPTLKQRYVAYDRQMGGIKPQYVQDEHGNWVIKPPKLPRGFGTTPAAGQRKSAFQLFKPPPKVMTPTHLLDKGLGTVKQAPKGLVEAYKPIVQSSAAAAKRPSSTIAGQAPSRTPVQRRPASTPAPAATAAATASSSSSSNPLRAPVRGAARVTKPSTPPLRKPATLSSSSTAPTQPAPRTARPMTRRQGSGPGLGPGPGPDPSPGAGAITNTVSSSRTSAFLAATSPDANASRPIDKRKRDAAQQQPASAFNVKRTRRS
ncbi:hypothetical protein KEM56_000124 [Ascosphaera pollenicola]|nr:hypothetical protein KEM56_000124 [Ascosphaera pollenicola]